jgi:hypothetical protein
MPQEHVELTIDNAQLRSNRDIGMIMRSTDHVKVLHTDVQFNLQDILWYMLPPEVTLEHIQLSISGKSRTKRCSTNLQTRDNLIIQQVLDFKRH